MVNHPLITTIEEFNREKYYYKLYLVRINYINKKSLIYLYCRNLYQIGFGGWEG